MGEGPGGHACVCGAVWHCILVTVTTSSGSFPPVPCDAELPASLATGAYVHGGGGSQSCCFGPLEAVMCLGVHLTQDEPRRVFPGVILSS